MKRLIIEYASLIVLLLLLNILSYCMGVIFVDDFVLYYYGHINLVDESSVIGVLFAPLMLMAIKKHEKGGIIIFSVFNVLLSVFCFHNDTMGYGGEVVSTFIFTVSKFNHLVSVILPNNLWQTINLTIIWGCYIVAIGYLYIMLKEKILNVKNGDKINQLKKNK